MAYGCASCDEMASGQTMELHGDCFDESGIIACPPPAEGPNWLLYGIIGAAVIGVLWLRRK